MPTVSPVRLAIMLGTLVALGPLAIDTYLPALPTMADDFGVAVHRIELSVSVYVLGVALGQWLGGPLSDHFGRKPVAYVGLSVFIVASLAITVCSQVGWLYGLRVLQALGGGATVVIAAASVRDHFNGREAARVLTSVGLVLLLALVLVPVLVLVLLLVRVLLLLLELVVVLVLVLALML
ncbi:MFS transporter, partial [Alloalcanivorax venustensis]|uniref:MFS transporter n=1 Tax=Alloalcanivorax venustensis TaxID=172371 RepID=UPI003C41F94E